MRTTSVYKDIVCPFKYSKTHNTIYCICWESNGKMSNDEMSELVKSCFAQKYVAEPEDHKLWEKSEM